MSTDRTASDRPFNPRGYTLRFSLRWLLATMLVGVVFLGRHVIEVRNQREAVAWVSEHDGIVRYDFQVGPQGFRINNPQPPRPEWLREILGLDFFADVVVVELGGFRDDGRVVMSEVSDLSPLAKFRKLVALEIRGFHVTDLLPLAELGSLQRLSISDAPVSDLKPISPLRKLTDVTISRVPVNDFRALADIQGLERLHIHNSPIDNLRCIGRLKNLKSLSISKTHVSDIRPLLSLKKLRRLSIYSSPITDIQPLSRLTNLQDLYIVNTPISDEDCNDLRRSSPNLRIGYSNR